METETPTLTKANPSTNEEAPNANYVAINYITCEPHYLARFEELFTTRAGAIDRLQGFLGMEVLKPVPGRGAAENEPYLVVSHWTSKSAFEGWLDSPEFREGHKRAFEDIRQAKERGEQSPMHSKFVTYDILTR